MSAPPHPTGSAAGLGQVRSTGSAAGLDLVGALPQSRGRAALWRALAAGVLLACAVGDLRAESARGLVKRGNAAYEAERYDEAMKAYEQADVESPESPVVAFNQGAVHYRAEDYAAARQAFAEAARRSRDPAFEASCRYNTGNCWFKEARRQMDSDLKKAVEACENSVDSYQAALALKPDFLEAKRNIEVVRRLWKSILDEQKRRQEEQKAQQEQQQKLQEELKQLIERQEKAAGQSAELAKKQDAEGSTQAVQEQSATQADAQRQLGEDTQAVTDSLQQRLAPAPHAAQASGTPGAAPGTAAGGASPPAQAPTHPALDHMGEARGLQDQATQKLEQRLPRPAAGDQTQAAAALRRALESLSQDQKEPPQQGGQEQREQQQQQGQQPAEQKPEQEKGKEEGEQKGKQDQQGQDQQGQDQQEEQGEPQQAASAQEGKEGEESEERQQASARLADQDARDILDEEKRNRDRRTAAEQDGIQPVDKDW